MELMVDFHPLSLLKPNEVQSGADVVAPSDPFTLELGVIGVTDAELP